MSRVVTVLTHRSRVLAAVSVVALAIAVPALRSQDQNAAGLRVLEKESAAASARYLELLGDYLRDEYEFRFSCFSEQDMQEIAAIRRLWQWYIADGPHPMGDPRKQSGGIFRGEFLDPIDRLADVLLIRPSEITDAKVEAARQSAFDLAERLVERQRRAGVNIDPTASKVSPTGIPYPHLDRPHTAVDRLRLFERTVVLARTVAPPEAEPVLMHNAEACAEIDIEEANFAMYGNQVRMLSGSIAWVVDPLMTACVRDFSNDKANGNGSGHQSTVPGKRFPGDRARRFGCRSGPEGAGGGRTGKQSIRGFAYNGTGHGGPLFARLRNVVAPGYRGGAFTAMYQTDAKWRHACQASRGELMLPPGVSGSQIAGSNRAIVKAMQRGAFATAWKRLNKGRGPADLFQNAVHRYLKAFVLAEVDWQLTGVERILAAGDAFEAERRLLAAKRALQDIPEFDRRAAAVAQRFADPAVAAEVAVGKTYDAILRQGERVPAGMRRLIEQHPESRYADAARHYLQAVEGDGAFWPELFYFVIQDTHLNKWAYLVPERLGK